MQAQACNTTTRHATRNKQNGWRAIVTKIVMSENNKELKSFLYLCGLE